MSDIENAKAKSEKKKRAEMDKKIIARAEHLAQQHPPLPSPWQWVRNAETGTVGAALWTHEYDCHVFVESGSLHISTGVAPVEVVAAVLGRWKGGAK